MTAQKVIGFYEANNKQHHIENGTITELKNENSRVKH
jgi:hypothetical protein